MSNHYDVVIVGGGIVGLTAAALLVKNNFSVALIEANSFPLFNNTLTARVSAIHATSQKLFSHLGVWELIAKSASPLQKMEIWDHTQQNTLHFDSSDIHKTEMGWIADNAAMIDALQHSLRGQIDLYCPNSVALFAREKNRIMLTLDNQKIIFADLVVGADGAHSVVREQMGVQMATHAYQQKAIIAVIETEKKHCHTAYQKFLTTGPVALLPLCNLQHTALVWSADHAVSDALMKKTQGEFSDALMQALDFKLGKLTLLTERRQFTLTMRHVDDYVTNQFALIGDAAHTIHPLAGLGVNLGLMDAACLTEILMQARIAKKPLEDLRYLRRYSRWRKSENTPIIASMQALKTIFALDQSPINFLRSLGIHTVDRCGAIKDHLMKVAMGESSTLPEFLKL